MMAGLDLLLYRDVNRGFVVISCSPVARCCVNNAENAGDCGICFNKWRIDSAPRAVSEKDFQSGTATLPFNVRLQNT